jgi:hypothetical protein
LCGVPALVSSINVTMHIDHQPMLNEFVILASRVVATAAAGKTETGAHGAQRIPYPLYTYTKSILYTLYVLLSNFRKILGLCVHRVRRDLKCRRSKHLKPVHSCGECARVCVKIALSGA